MQLTNKQLDWLERDNIKIVLIDAAYHDGTSLKVEYFSNYPYIMSSVDASTNLIGELITDIGYEDIISNIPVLSSRIDFSTNVGVMELINADGEFDHLLDFAWEGHPIEIFLGDTTWAKDEFILIYSGISESLRAPTYSTLNIEFSDKKKILEVESQTQVIDVPYVTSLYADPINSPGFIGDERFLVISIEVNIKLVDGPETIAALTTAAIATLPEFSGSTVTNTCTISGVANGNTNDAIDVDTTFTINVTQQGVDGDGGSVEITTINTGVVAPAALSGKYFLINSVSKSYCIWYNLDSTSTIPQTTMPNNLAPFDPSTIIIPDNILNSLVPICIGECFNIEPVLIDEANHVYQIHEGGLNKGIQAVLEVRSNGIVLTSDQYLINLPAGCIRLLVHTKNTQITCDVIGQNGRSSKANLGITLANNSVAYIIEWLALEKTKLLGSDICPITFPKLEFQIVAGVYIKESNTVLSIATDVASSVGAFTRFGSDTYIYQLVQLQDPAPQTPNLFMVEDDIIEKSLSIVENEVLAKSIHLGYLKNWTIQDKGAMATALLDPTYTEDLGFIDKITSENSSVKVVSTVLNIDTIFPLLAEGGIINTLLVNKIDAVAEADRRITLRSITRRIYRLEGVATPLTILVGDIINLTHSRYGFANGINTVVVGLEEDPINKRAIVEVWV